MEEQSENLNPKREREKTFDTQKGEIESDEHTLSLQFLLNHTLN